MWVSSKTRERERSFYIYTHIHTHPDERKIVDDNDDVKNRIQPVFSSFGQINLYIVIMSQSATLIRVAKHALDGTPLYPHHGQNTIYYQPFDLSANGASAATKYLAYTIQRAPEPRLPVATHSVKKKSLFTQFYLSLIVIEDERKKGIWRFSRQATTQFSLSLSPFPSGSAVLFD